MQQYKIIGKAGDLLAQELASRLGVAYNSFSITTFADSESSVAVQAADQLVGQSLVVVYQYRAGLEDDPINNQLFNLLLVINTLKNRGAARIILVLPYYPYARHDKDAMGAHNNVAWLASLYRHAGVHAILTLDIHSEQIIQPGGFIESLSLGNLWAEHIRVNFAHDYACQQLVLVSPDEGGFRRVEQIAQILDLPVAKILKKRISADESIALSLEGAVAGKHALIIDDIIDTGTTASNALALLSQHGVRKVSACFSHAVFSRLDTAKQVFKQCNQVYYTDSILRPSITPDGILLKVCDFLVEQLKQRLAGLLSEKGPE